MMAKIWYAGPKKGRANFFNLVRVSAEGLWADLLCGMPPIVLATQADDLFFPDASLLPSLFFTLLIFVSVFTLIRLIFANVFRSRIDFDNPHTKYRDGELIEPTEAA